MLLYTRISRCQLASTICHTLYNTSGHVDVILLLWRQTIDLLKATHLISSVYAFNEDVYVYSIICCFRRPPYCLWSIVYIIWIWNSRVLVVESADGCFGLESTLEDYFLEGITGMVREVTWRREITAYSLFWSYLSLAQLFFLEFGCGWHCKWTALEKVYQYSFIPNSGTASSHCTGMGPGPVQGIGLAQ